MIKINLLESVTDRPKGVALVEDARPQPGADEGADDAQDDGHEGGDVLLAGKNEPCQGANDRTQDHGDDDGGEHVSHSFAGQGPELNVDGRSEPPVG